MLDASVETDTAVLQPRLLPPRWAGVLMAAADALAVDLAIALSLLLRWYFGEYFEKAAQFDLELPVIGAAGIVAVNAILGLYPGYGLSGPERFRRRLVGTLLVFAMVAGWDYLLQHGLWSRMVMVASCGLALLLTVLLNDLVRRGLQERKLWGVPVAVYGDPRSIAPVVQLLRSRAELGFLPVACIADDAHDGCGAAGLPLVETHAAPAALAGVRHVFVYLPHLAPEHWERVLDRLRFPQVFLIPSLSGQRSLWVRTTDLQGTLALSLGDNLLDRRKLVLKRAIDLALTVPLLVLLLPLFATIAAAVRMTSRGPALFVQERVGQHGDAFDAIKFRTMVADAEERLADYLQEHPQARLEYETYRKLRRDPRVTPIGAFLRRHSLDELPQLLNVIRGDMSLVGPRCYLPEEIVHMDGQEPLIHSVKPGITGFWQISGRNRSTFAERVAMDAYYIRNWSVWFDLYILYETIWAVLSARDAY